MILFSFEGLCYEFLEIKTKEEKFHGKCKKELFNILFLESWTMTTELLDIIGWIKELRIASSHFLRVSMMLTRK